MLLPLPTHWAELVNAHTMPAFLPVCSESILHPSQNLALVCKGLHFPSVLAVWLPGSFGHWEAVMGEWRTGGVEKRGYFILFLEGVSSSSSSSFSVISAPNREAWCSSSFHKWLLGSGNTTACLTLLSWGCDRLFLCCSPSSIWPLSSLNTCVNSSLY